MSKTVETKLLRTSSSGDLLPARLAPLLAKWSSPRAKLRGQELRVAGRLSLDDDACAGFVLDFAAQGARIEGAAPGASGALLAWAVHELGTQVKAEVTGPDVDRAAAMAYLEAYEADVERARKARDEHDGNNFVAWLVREELLALAEDAGAVDFSELAMDDPAKAYETLLDHEAVDDIFVSERELTRLVSRFRAR